MKRKFSVIKITIGIILIVLIVSNPSLKDFKEFKGIEPEAKYDKAVRRNYNFILFSIYQQADENSNYGSIYYLGVLDLFFEFQHYN